MTTTIQTYSDETIQLAGEDAFQWENRKLVGWNTKPDGSGVPYGLGEMRRFDESTTLYAQWRPAALLVENLDLLVTEDGKHLNIGT